MTNRPYLGIVVPAFNEEKRLIATLNRLVEFYQSQDYSWKVVIVSDGSTDGTDELVAEFCRQNDKFDLLTYKQNCGKGYAVRVGMLSTEADLLLFCDADLATPQEETEHLIQAINEGADVAIGSRPLRESRLEIRQPIYREILGRAFNKVVQLLAIKGIEDTQCGFKLFTNKAAKEIFSRSQIDRFSFDIEALLIARDLGFKIKEIPIRWSHQEGSKVSIVRDGTKMIGDLIKLRFLGKKNRLQVRTTLGEFGHTFQDSVNAKSESN